MLRHGADCHWHVSQSHCVIATERVTVEYLNQQISQSISWAITDGIMITITASIMLEEQLRPNFSPSWSNGMCASCLSMGGFGFCSCAQAALPYRQRQPKPDDHGAQQHACCRCNDAGA